MYKDKAYAIRDFKAIRSDIDILAKNYPNANKVFLADGDALSLPTEQLIKILNYLQNAFHKLRRVSVYASAQNLLHKTPKELELLSKHKLNLIYFGIETGSNLILKKITKGVEQGDIIAALNKATQAGMKVSATVILGLGGIKYSHEHIKETAAVINATAVNYLSTLQLGLEEDAKDNFYKHFSDFKMLDDYQILEEQRHFIESIEPSNKIIFRSNHASNALHLSGTLPKDKDRLIQELESATIFNFKL